METMQTEYILTRNHTVRLTETGPNGTLRPAELMMLLQNIANEHAVKLGFGLEELTANNKAWVAARYHIKISSFPRQDQQLTLKTWPSGQKGLLYYRDFEILDETGAVLISATSGWLIIDLKTRRPLRPRMALDNFPIVEKRAIDTNFEQLPELENCDYKKDFATRFGEIDVNRHINSAVFVTWAIESVPPEMLLSSEPCEIEIAFKSEVLFGQTVEVDTQLQKINTETRALHLITDKQTGKEAARLRTVWKPNDTDIKPKR